MKHIKTCESKNLRTFELFGINKNKNKYKEGDEI